MSIELKNVEIGYKGKILKSNFSYSFNNKGLYCLVGKNGSGKTTFLRTLCGIIPSVSGEVIKHSNLLGYVSTKRVEVDYLNVREYLLFGNVKLEDGLLNKLEVDELLPNMVNNLSDGQYKRVSLARQMLKRPEILILDEPSAFLDFDQKHKLTNLLRELSNSILVILSTNDLAFLEALNGIVINVDGE